MPPFVIIIIKTCSTNICCIGSLHLWLKSAKINVQQNIIWQLRRYEIELNPNNVKATKNICSAKGDLAVDHNVIIRYLKKKRLDYKDLNNWARSCRLKTVDSVAVLQTIATNPNPPQEQDVTQGQFLNEDSNLVFLLLNSLSNQG